MSSDDFKNKAKKILNKKRPLSACISTLRKYIINKYYEIEVKIIVIMINLVNHLLILLYFYLFR